MIKTLGTVDEKALAEIREEMKIRRTSEVFLLFALGSQFDHLIKQALEKLGVFCIVADPRRVNAQDVQKVKPIGIILSGGPASVYNDPPPFDKKIFNLGIPVLGICLGFQMWAQHVGLDVKKAEKREFGTHKFVTMGDCDLFYGLPPVMLVLESHGDRILPRGDKLDRAVLGTTEHAPMAAGNWQHLWGVQFHPEVPETKFGWHIFENFCFKICKAKDRFPAGDVARQKINELREAIGDKDVLLALSGGTDSATVAYLLKAALAGKISQLRAVYIKGIDRPDDEKHVLEFFANSPWLDLRIVDASEKFLRCLNGIESGHFKRVAMREIYKEVLEAEIKGFGAHFIAQGTLYTDISESGHGYDSGAQKAQIKLHHNVGLGFSVPELLPLADQVKDTGRDIGRAIGVPEELLVRHPFPGPGLVIRIEGEVTKDRLRVARQLDAIFIAELRKAGLYEKVWQAGVELTNSVRTCTKGDDAVSGWVAVAWAFYSVNGFTATAAIFPEDFQRRVSQRMVNEIREIGYVSFGATDKPPATIEWE